MKWFNNVPTIKFTEFYTVGSKKTTKDWAYVERIGEAWSDHSYTVLKHIPTNKLYRTTWGILDKNGFVRPTGNYDPDNDYKMLKEVKAELVTHYNDI